MSPGDISKLAEESESPSLAETVFNFYGLREQPFGTTPDPRFLYLTPSYQEALAALLCGIDTGRGFTSLLAQPGMGKTTLLFRLLDQYKNSARTAYLFQTQCDSQEFLRYLLAELGIEPAPAGLVGMHEKLNEVLLREVEAGRRFVVFIDEAHNLDDRVLETVRLLSDFEMPDAKLMQMVLAGHPTLADKLGFPALRQRVSIQAHLEPLTADETAGYIDHRLRIAGHTGDPLFTREAQDLIAAHSEGIPRNINNLCFHALVTGCVLSQPTIDAEIVREVLADLGLPVASKPSESLAPEFPEVSTNGAGEPPAPARADASRPLEVLPKGLELEELQQRIEQASRQALQPFANELEEKVKQGLDSASARLAEEVRGRVQNEVSAALDAFNREVGTRLHTLEEEHLSSAMGNFQAQMSEQVQKLRSDLQAALEPFREFTTLPALADGEILNRFDQARQQAQEACQHADAAASNIGLASESAVNKLRAAEQEMEAQIAQAGGELRKLADDTLQSPAKQLQKQAAETVKQFDAELHALETKFVHATTKQLAAIPEKSRESLTRETAKIVEECRDQLERTLHECVRRSVQELEVESTQVLENQQEALWSRRDLSNVGVEDLRHRFSPGRRRLDWEGVLKLAAWVASFTSSFLVIAFVAFSIHPRMNLRPYPPADFVEQRPEWSADRRSKEELLARAYWESAIRTVQPKYGFGVALPDAPPAEFKPEGVTLQAGNQKSDAETRKRYWRNLAGVWSRPEVWEKKYVWSTEWIDSLLASLP